MKKLMVIAAIVCAAAVSQAASIKWQITDSTATDAVGNLVYLVTSAGTFKTVDELVAAALPITGDVNSGTIIAGSRGGETLSGASQNSSWEAGPVKFYYAVLNSGSTATATGYWITTEQTATAVTSGTPTASKYTSLGTLTAGTMTKFDSVPEPTSGLLLLLGVAGLALRRRRA